MSYKDYQQSREIAIMDFPYYAMVMAAYRTEDAGRENCTKIENEWPTAFRRAYDTEVGIVARNSNPEYTFQAWIMALCRKSDTKNTAIIQPGAGLRFGRRCRHDTTRRAASCGGRRYERKSQPDPPAVQHLRQRADARGILPDW
jgi:hypothetical protein